MNRTKNQSTLGFLRTLFLDPPGQMIGLETIRMDGSWYVPKDSFADRIGLWLTLFLRTIQFAPISPMKAAELGNVKDLKVVAVLNKTSLFEEDENGWQPIHLAARAGHVDVVDCLLKNGADVDARTYYKGGSYSPLKIAMDNHGEDHPVVLLLQNHGGHVLSWEDDNEL
jgi:hypothetical protein